MFNGCQTQRTHQNELPGVTFTPREQGRGRPRLLPGWRRGGSPASTQQRRFYYPLPFRLCKALAKQRSPGAASVALGPVSARVQRSLFISRRALCLAWEKGFVLWRGTRALLHSSMHSPSMHEGGCLCSAPNPMHLLKKKNKPGGENSRQCRYRHANKNNTTKTLIFRVSAAESPATQRRESQPAPGAASPQPLGKQQIQAHRSRRSGTSSQSRRRMGTTGSHARSGILNPNFLTSLPYSPVPPHRCQRRHPPAPADRTAASGQKQKTFPPRSRLRNYPCILPEASAPLLFLGFSTFPPHSVTSVLRERHRVTHFTH